jgi:hypothetical protein
MRGCETADSEYLTAKKISQHCFLVYLKEHLVSDPTANNIFFNTELVLSDGRSHVQIIFLRW